MMRIEKKIWTETFEQISSGNKTFDVRLADDFKCEQGDTFVLKEWSPEKKDYTGRVIEKKVGFVFKVKDMEKFHTKEELQNHDLLVISLK